MQKDLSNGGGFVNQGARSSDPVCSRPDAVSIERCERARASHCPGPLTRRRPRGEPLRQTQQACTWSSRKMKSLGRTSGKMPKPFARCLAGSPRGASRVVPSGAARAESACASAAPEVWRSSATRGCDFHRSAHNRRRRPRGTSEFERCGYRLDPGTCRAYATVEKWTSTRGSVQKNAAAVFAGRERQAMRDRRGYKATNPPLPPPTWAVAPDPKIPKLFPAGSSASFQPEVAAIRYAQQNQALASQSQKCRCEGIRETGRLLLRTSSRASRATPRRDTSQAFVPAYPPHPTRMGFCLLYLPPSIFIKVRSIISSSVTLRLIRPLANSCSATSSIPFSAIRPSGGKEPRYKS